MKKLIILSFLITTISCSSNEKALEAKAKHQSETGSRLNESQKNTQKVSHQKTNANKC